MFGARSTEQFAMLLRRRTHLRRVDANVQIDSNYRDANLVGSTISRTTTSQAAERDNVNSMLAQAQAHGLRFMNTFENF